MYTNARYVSYDGFVTGIKVEISGIPTYVPLDTMNGDYNEIMRLVDAGELVIAEAN